MLVIKNVILYDPYQNVVGFAELKNVGDKTNIKLKHNVPNLPDTVVTINGEMIKGDTIDVMDLNDEVVICIIQKVGNTVSTLASGIINPRPIDLPPSPLSKSFASLPPLKAILSETEQNAILREHQTCGKHRTTAAKEIDQVLRAVCQVDDQNNGVCKTCPYREFFYGEDMLQVNKNDEQLVISSTQ